jgi:uncharacterized protein (DUF2235 family)
MTQRFKETFSRTNVRVHFVGVWYDRCIIDCWHTLIIINYHLYRDTVSSVGISRSKALPLVHSHEHICFFRHALSLDECRVKFLPEYIHGGESVTQKNIDSGQEHGSMRGMQGKSQGDGEHRITVQPPVKEVWFAGSHSDV